MDYVGLVQKFKVNRPLTDEERAMRLRQKERLQVDPSDQLAVIKVNSTFVETVDRYYANKGWLTLWAMAGLSLTVVLFSISVSPVFIYPDELMRWIAVVLVGTAISFGLFAIGGWLFFKEALSYTHFPLRLNRKTRMVHAFRQDGTVLTVPWDEVFFAIGRGMRPYGVQNWDVRGHVLAEDGETVQETFCFADVESREIVTRHWEFLRRYMEDGPEAAYRKIKYCMPVDGRRETFRDSYWRLMEEEWFLPLRYLGFPLIILAICARWLAMRLGKVPHWPAEIEAACRIDPGDPYIKDARRNPPELRVGEPADAVA